MTIWDIIMPALFLGFWVWLGLECRLPTRQGRTMTARLPERHDADRINLILSEFARVENGRLANSEYLAVKIAEGLERVTADMVERGLAAMNGGLIDARQPFHESDKLLMRAALTAALNKSGAIEAQ